MITGKILLCELYKIPGLSFIKVYRATDIAYFLELYIVPGTRFIEVHCIK